MPLPFKSPQDLLILPKAMCAVMIAGIPASGPSIKVQIPQTMLAVASPEETAGAGVGLVGWFSMDFRLLG